MGGVLYIRIAYYPYIIIMKYLSLVCIALCITISASAQFQPVACPTYSYWDGTSDFVGFTAYISPQDDCCEVYAPTGKYLYWDGSTPLGDQLPNTANCLIGFSATGDSSYNDSYGLKGKGSIYNPTNVYLDMEVFETMLGLQTDFGQTISEPEFLFRGGNFRFNSMLAVSNTIIRIGNGARVEISNQLRVEQNAQIIVEEGGELVLLADENGQAYINTTYSSNIQGKITKQAYYNRKSSTDQTYLSQTIYNRFVFNPGLYNVSMHLVAKSIQDQLDIEYVDGSVDRPTVQIGQWVDREFATEYEYFANQEYRKFNSNIPNRDVGVVSLNASHYNTASTDGGFNPDTLVVSSAVNGYELNYFEGAAVLPLYNNTENTTVDIFADEQFLGLSNNEIPIFVSQQIDWSRTKQEKSGPFIISISNANPVVNSFTIEYTGLYDNNAFFQELANYAVISNTEELTAEPGTYTYSAPIDTLYGIGFDRTPMLNTPLNYQYLFDFGVHTQEANGYRPELFNGFNIIKNTTGNYLKLDLLAKKLHGLSPDIPKTFYDLRYLIPDMKEREYSTLNLSNGFTMEAPLHSLVFQMPPVASYLAIPVVPSLPGLDKLVDIYNIPGLPFLTSIGDTLYPTDAIAMNMQSVKDFSTFHGQEEIVDFYQTGLDEKWLNGNQGAWNDPDLNFSHAPVDPPYDQSEVQIAALIPSYSSWQDGSEPNEAPASSVIQDVDYWNNESEFTLIVLKGITPSDDTIRLAAIPIAFKENYSAQEIERFETSVAPHPGFHLIDPNPSTTTYIDSVGGIPPILVPLLDSANQESITMVDGGSKPRTLGAYARGYTENVDSLEIVFNRKYFYPLQGIETFIIETDIKQQTSIVNNGAWHWLVGDQGPYGTGMCFEDPDFSYLIDNYETSTAKYDDLLDNYVSPASGTLEEFVGEIISFYPSPLIGDLNFDGTITTSDLLLLLAQFGTSVNTFFSGDLNTDGFVGAADMITFLTQYGQTLFGPNANAYGTSEFVNNINERIAYLFEPRSNVHQVYDFRDYPGFTTQQSTWWNGKDLRGCQLFVTDELGWVVFKKDLTTYTNGFKLPSDMPTTAQLIQTETGGFPEGFADYTKGYKIYIYFPNKVSFPGYADPIKKLCLGCEDPDTPTALQEHPVFISN